jgi:hypothetical protein
VSNDTVAGLRKGERQKSPLTQRERGSSYVGVSNDSVADVANDIRADYITPSCHENQSSVE